MSAKGKTNATTLAPVRTGASVAAACWFQPGSSGNPLGRPKGARNKLGEDFLRALEEDFSRYGESVIRQVREEKPHEYLKIVVSILPKQIETKEGAFDGVSDEELSAIVTAARAALAFNGGGGE